MNQEDYRKLISGRNRGIGATILRLFLYLASIFYLLAIRLRNLLYDARLLKIRQADAAVISIGNITAGGTGKTPLVIWLCKFLQKNEIQYAILTRGYKAQTKRQETRDERRETKIDEPGILAESCPQVKVIVNPDRVAGANEAIEKFGASVLVMDDGFQHRRLGRDLDIVTIDATRPFGYGRLLPAGLLREPMDSLKRAGAVVITRSNQVTESELKKIEAKIQKIKPDIIITKAVHSPVCAKTTDNKEINTKKLKGKKIFAFCGIGNPDAFIETIKGLGADPVGTKIYDDHYHYTKIDVENIYEQAKEQKVELILTTQKDFSKLPKEKRQARADIPLGYLEIELKLVSGEDAITRLIKRALAGRIRGH